MNLRALGDISHLSKREWESNGLPGPILLEAHSPKGQILQDPPGQHDKPWNTFSIFETVMDMSPFCSNTDAIFQAHRISALFIIVPIRIVAEARRSVLSVCIVVLAAVELFQSFLVELETCTLRLLDHPY
jgi:hypothetical protein